MTTALYVTLVLDRYDGAGNPYVTGSASLAPSVPVPRPADPKANPSRVQSYEWYERFVSLGRSLGC